MLGWWSAAAVPGVCLALLQGSCSRKRGVGIIDVAVYSNDFGLPIFGVLCLLQGAVHVACVQCAPESSFGRAIVACGVSMGTVW